MKSLLRRHPLLLFAVLLSIACSTDGAIVHLNSPARSYEPGDYKSVLRTWTRSRRLNTLEEMDNVLTVTSTYHSADFRSAYLAKYASDFHLEPTEVEAMRAEHMQLTEKVHEFYVALFAQTMKYARLDEEDGAFQVHLVDDRGTAIKPARIERIERPGVVEYTYFPYTNSYRSVYRIVFDQSRAHPSDFSGAKWFGLRFSGPQGTTVLKWVLG